MSDEQLTLEQITGCSRHALPKLNCLQLIETFSIANPEYSRSNCKQIFCGIDELRNVLVAFPRRWLNYHLLHILHILYLILQLIVAQ